MDTFGFEALGQFIFQQSKRDLPDVARFDILLLQHVFSFSKSRNIGKKPCPLP
jgi:hypothetical protein